MKLKKCMMLMLAVAFSAGILAGCGSTPQQKEQPKDSPKTPLRVATNATFVPFEFKGEEDSDYKGYEVDMIRAVGKAMGREIQFNNIPFSGIIPIIQAGDMDLAASGMDHSQMDHSQMRQDGAASQPMDHSQMKH